MLQAKTVAKKTRKNSMAESIETFSKFDLQKVQIVESPKI
jgi:hypothetical protein